jgi:hypothetical protein
MLKNTVGRLTGLWSRGRAPTTQEPAAVSPPDRPNVSEITPAPGTLSKQNVPTTYSYFVNVNDGNEDSTQERLLELTGWAISAADLRQDPNLPVPDIDGGTRPAGVAPDMALTPAARPSRPWTPPTPPTSARTSTTASRR